MSKVLSAESHAVRDKDQCDVDKHLRRLQIERGGQVVGQVVILKPVVTNLYLGCLALETLVFSLSVFLALGNSFYFMVGDMACSSGYAGFSKACARALTMSLSRRRWNWS